MSVSKGCVSLLIPFFLTLFKTPLTQWGRTKDVNTPRKTLETVRVFHSSHQVFQAHVMLAAEIRKPWLTLILSINAKMTSPQTPLWMP